MPAGTLASVLGDRSFPALANAAEAHYLNPILAQALDAPTANLIDVTVLNHKPGRRCTLLYDVTAGDTRVRVVGKWQRDARVALRQHDRLRELNASPDVPSLPRALLVTPEGLTLQSFVAGAELRDLAGNGDLRPFVAAGEWLARLHRLQPVMGLSLKTRGHELAKVESWLATVAAEGSLAANAMALRSRLTHLGSALPTLAPVMIHRDYYPANLIWDGTQVIGIDIDQLALGDAAVDEAAFIAQLEKLALRTTGHIDAYAKQREAFIAAYGNSASSQIDHGALAFFSAYTFAKLAAAEVQRQRPGWPGVAAEFLRRGFELMDV